MERQYPFTHTFSNESQIFATNTLYSFRTCINPPLSLPVKQWEVALTRMILPQTRNIFMPSSEFEIRHYHYYDDIAEFNPIVIKIKIESKFYHSIEELLKWLNQTILLAITKVYIRRNDLYDIRHGRLPSAHFEITLSNHRVNLSNIMLTGLPSEQIQRTKFKITRGHELWSLLGFQILKMNKFTELPIVAKFPPSLAEENSTLVLFSPSFVVDQNVGQTTRPLLEIIPYNFDSTSEFSVFEQKFPLYKIIFGGYINNIQFELADVENKPLFFESGKVQIELHFRPCQNLINW